MQPKLIGKYLSFKFGKAKFSLSGVVLACNENYTLIKNFNDYLPDGFIVFKNDKVEIVSGQHEKTASKILKARKYSHNIEPIAPLDSLESLFGYINQHYQLLGLNTPNGDAMDVVRWIKRKNDKYLFHELTVAAKWRFKLELPEKECRIIKFDTGYLNSMKLITRF